MGIYERQEREKAIIAAAEEVFFRYGFRNAKMEDVAKKAAMSKGLVYFYFQNKDDLYMAITLKAFEIIIGDYQRILNENSHKTGKEKTLLILKTYLDFSNNHYHYHETIFNYMSMVRSELHLKADGMFQSAIEDSLYYQKIKQIHNLPVSLVVGAIKEGMKDGSIKNTHNAQTIYVTLWAMVIGYVRLNITMGKKNETIYHVDSVDWQKYIFELTEGILNGE